MDASIEAEDFDSSGDIPNKLVLVCSGVEGAIASGVITVLDVCIADDDSSIDDSTTESSFIPNKLVSVYSVVMEAMASGIVVDDDTGSFDVVSSAASAVFDSIDSKLVGV